MQAASGSWGETDFQISTGERDLQQTCNIWLGKSWIDFKSKGKSIWQQKSIKKEEWLRKLLKASMFEFKAGRPRVLFSQVKRATATPIAPCFGFGWLYEMEETTPFFFFFSKYLLLLFIMTENIGHRHWMIGFGNHFSFLFVLLLFLC